MLAQRKEKLFGDALDEETKRAADEKERAEMECQKRQDAETQAERDKVRADTAERLHSTLVKEIKPSVEEGFESLTDKVALKITGPGKKKRTDKSLSDRRLEQKIYSHYKSICPTMRRKKFTEEFYGDYGLTKEEMFLLLERVRKRLERGTK